MTSTLQAVIIFLSAIPFAFGDVLNIPLESSLSSGAYQLDIYMGTPSQSLVMHLDTGSDLFIVPSSSCQSCQDANHLYDISKSSTAEKIGCTSSRCGSWTCSSCYSGQCSSNKCCDRTDSSQCGFYVSYMDGAAVEGGLVRDAIAVRTESGMSPSADTTFGLAAVRSGNWGGPTDGIMGMSYGNVYGSPTKTSTWYEELISSHESYDDSFSICFGRTQGLLSIGSLDSSLYEGPLYSVDMQDDYYYTVRLNDIRIDDHSFLSAAYLAVIDSGSTLSHFPRQVFEDLRAYLISQYGFPSDVIDGNQYVLSDPSSTWPVIDIYVDGVYLSLPPSVYFFRVSSLWSSRWLFGIASSDTSFFILGDTFMSAFLTVFNRQQGVISFAVPSSLCHCESVGALNETSYRPPVNVVSVFAYVIGAIVICVIVVCIIICCCKSKKA